MNGRFPPLRQLWATGRSGEDSRLIAALVLSCLVHATLLFLPMLGAGQQEYRSAIKGERQAGPYFVNAILVQKEGEHRFSGIPVPAEGERVPDSSVTALDSGNQVRPAEPGAAGIGLLPLPGQDYYTTDQLSKRPQPTAPADLDPSDIKPIVASGKVVLKLWITNWGSVAKVEVESSNLPDLFTRAAVDGFKRLAFVPGERDGRPVGTVMRVEVIYQDGRELHR